MKKGKAFYQNLMDLPVKSDLADIGMVAFKVSNNEPEIILKDTATFPEVNPTIWFEVYSV